MRIDGIEYTEVLEITDYQVMCSNAGFYIGRSAITTYSNGDYVPFDRLSGYYPSQKDAEQSAEVFWDLKIYRCKMTIIRF
ncbi:hypothetical protein [Brevibacillus laterosporus]|uniref:hypothetical protein n=1 Tax=Brevibacillus laterosporus TaxID=1465 RepID=UPI0003B23E4B|nr:hypothetical protein [Brevibacillus laterosporus]ERM19682.1 hypothetical protein P615_10055 [Brevibacillus laterosporus PE36]